MKKPWFRRSNCTWYLELDGGKQLNLGRDTRFKLAPKEAPKSPPPEIQKAYLKAMERQGEPEDRTLSFCIDEYMRSLDACTEDTRKRARYFLGLFLKAVGDRPVSKLKAHHVDDARKGLDWKPNSIRNFVNTITACLNYNARKGWISANPLRLRLEKPPVERREVIMSPEDRRRVLDASEGCFREILTALSETGMRPIEARFARIEDFDPEKGVLKVRNKTRKATGNKVRPVFLSSRMLGLFRELIGDRAEGWIFRNSKGGQWTQTALEHRLQKLCKKLGIIEGAQLYSFRHGWASTSINQRKLNPALVALQLGHSDLKMLMATYLHADAEAIRRELDG